MRVSYRQQILLNPFARLGGFPPVGDFHALLLEVADAARQTETPEQVQCHHAVDDVALLQPVFYLGALACAACCIRIDIHFLFF